MTAWTALNPQFAERVRDSFAKQPMLQTLGASLGNVAPGYCEIHLPFQQRLTQHHGYLHGGAYALLADTAGGYAAFSLIAASDSALTVEYKLNMLQPGKDGLFIAKGEVIKPGKTLMIVRADVYHQARDGAELLLCTTSLQTIMVMKNVADSTSSPATAQTEKA